MGTYKKTGPNNNHYLFKGDKVGYVSLHGWVRRHKVDPKYCEHCKAEDKKLQWANKSHEYKRELDDWLRLCIPCHRKHDRDDKGNKRIDTAKFGMAGRDRKPGKLTKEQIIEIFLSMDQTPVLAKKFNVRDSYINRIRTRERAARITKDLVAPIRKNPSFKLDIKTALMIFNYKGEQKKLANKLGVSPGTICDIKKGRTWKSVTNL